MGSQRVKTLLSKYGEDYFSRIGKIGFQVTTDRHFGGDRKAHYEWLRRKGAFAVDSQLPYHKPECYPDPGPHPAWYAFWGEWLDDVVSKI